MGPINLCKETNTRSSLWFFSVSARPWAGPSGVAAMCFRPIDQFLALVSLQPTILTLSLLKECPTSEVIGKADSFPFTFGFRNAGHSGRRCLDGPTSRRGNVPKNDENHPRNRFENQYSATRKVITTYERCNGTIFWSSAAAPPDTLRLFTLPGKVCDTV